MSLAETMTADALRADRADLGRAESHVADALAAIHCCERLDREEREQLVEAGRTFGRMIRLVRIVKGGNPDV